MRKPTVRLATKAGSDLDQQAGTVRWPKSCESDGNFIKFPKILAKRFFDLKIEPHHLLLILMLKVDEYRDRKVRYYWEELAQWCGRDRNTVRRWAYELKKKGLLSIRTNRKLSQGENPRPGHRNERNEFELTGLSVRLGRVQAAADAEKNARQKKSKAAEE